MSIELLDTPVAFFVFNRPTATQRVFEAIRQVRPRQLLIVADGPRAGSDDVEKCAEVRTIVQNVDWPCEVLTNFSEVNLGCKHRVSTGLDWVFLVAEEAIILEDDCLPDPTFFRFCEELLCKYRDDDRIRHIGGANFQMSQRAHSHSYYFSGYPHVWGWASWRRAWQYYDVTLSAWVAAVEKADFLRSIQNRSERAFWREVWNAVSAGRIDTWDYQWAFACMQAGSLSIVPARNLVTNIGFGSNSTNTRHASAVAELPSVPMAFPLSHPSTVARASAADDFTRRLFFTAPSFVGRAIAGLRRRLNGRMA
jgi:hypothetical protein